MVLCGNETTICSVVYTRNVVTSVSISGKGINRIIYYKKILSVWGAQNLCHCHQKITITWQTIILLNSLPIDALAGRYRKGSKRGGQQSPRQQAGLHGNPATAHLQAPVNTALRNQRVGINILIHEYLRGKEQRSKQARSIGRSNAMQSTRQCPWNPSHIKVTANQHWLEFNFASIPYSPIKYTVCFNRIKWFSCNAYFILKVVQSTAKANSWWPKQIPNRGLGSACSVNLLMFFVATVVNVGSPGPLLRKTPSHSKEIQQNCV